MAVLLYLLGLALLFLVTNGSVWLAIRLKTKVFLLIPYAILFVVCAADARSDAYVVGIVISLLIAHRQYVLYTEKDPWRIP
jgi:hypothetical protein